MTSSSRSIPEAYVEAYEALTPEGGWETGDQVAVVLDGEDSLTIATLRTSNDRWYFYASIDRAPVPFEVIGRWVHEGQVKAVYAPRPKADPLLPTEPDTVIRVRIEGVLHVLVRTSDGDYAGVGVTDRFKPHEIPIGGWILLDEVIEDEPGEDLDPTTVEGHPRKGWRHLPTVNGSVVRATLKGENQPQNMMLDGNEWESADDFHRPDEIEWWEPLMTRTEWMRLEP